MGTEARLAERMLLLFDRKYSNSKPRRPLQRAPSSAMFDVLATSQLIYGLGVPEKYMVEVIAEGLEPNTILPQELCRAAVARY